MIYLYVYLNKLKIAVISFGKIEDWLGCYCQRGLGTLAANCPM